MKKKNLAREIILGLVASSVVGLSGVTSATPVPITAPIQGDQYYYMDTNVSYAVGAGYLINGTIGSPMQTINVAPGTTFTGEMPVAGVPYGTYRKDGISVLDRQGVHFNNTGNIDITVAVGVIMYKQRCHLIMSLVLIFTQLILMEFFPEMDK